MLASLLLLAAQTASGGTALDTERAVRLDVEESAERVEIALFDTSKTRQTVAYEIEVRGASTSRHSGKTTLGGGGDTPLSRFTVSHRGTWCAKAKILEENGVEYTLEAGDCD